MHVTKTGRNKLRRFWVWISCGGKCRHYVFRNLFALWGTYSFWHTPQPCKLDRQWKQTYIAWTLGYSTTLQASSEVKTRVYRGDIVILHHSKSKLGGENKWIPRVTIIHHHSASKLGSENKRILRSDYGISPLCKRVRQWNKHVSRGDLDNYCASEFGTEKKRISRSEYDTPSLFKWARKWKQAYSPRADILILNYWSSEFGTKSKRI